MIRNGRQMVDPPSFMNLWSTGYAYAEQQAREELEQKQEVRDLRQRVASLEAGQAKGREADEPRPNTFSLPL